SSYAKVVDGYAERFELYIRGIEIANGWTEETNSEEIRRRMENFARGRDLPFDEELIRAYEDFPPCAGCSIGLERLFMVYKGLNSLDDIYF
ncbi:MAG: amino acid--tRNA ligase-related protein, partial [Aquificaceae bacterium]